MSPTPRRSGRTDRTLDPAAGAIENERRVRALHPHIGARLELADGSFLGVRRARAREDGPLELIEVQPPGGRPMPYADYGAGTASPRSSGGARRDRRRGVSASPARRAAHAVVLRTLSGGAYADRALHCEARGLDPRDRALAKRLAFGAVQRRGTHDWIISGLARPGKIDSAVRAALHIGLEQLLFMDGIAEHAAVAESVELAKPSPATGWSTRSCGAFSARASSCRPTTTRPAPRSATRTRSGSCGCGGTGSGATHAGAARGRQRAGRARAARQHARDAEPLIADIDGRRDGEAIVVDGAFDALAHPGFAAGAFVPQSRAAQRVAPFARLRSRASACSTCARRRAARRPTSRR